MLSLFVVWAIAEWQKPSLAALQQPNSLMKFIYGRCVSPGKFLEVVDTFVVVFKLPPGEAPPLPNGQPGTHLEKHANPNGSSSEKPSEERLVVDYPCETFWGACTLLELEDDAIWFFPTQADADAALLALEEGSKKSRKALKEELDLMREHMFHQPPVFRCTFRKLFDSRLQSFFKDWFDGLGASEGGDKVQDRFMERVHSALSAQPSAQRWQTLRMDQSVIFGLPPERGATARCLLDICASSTPAAQMPLQGLSKCLSQIEGGHYFLLDTPENKATKVLIHQKPQLLKKVPLE